VRGRARFGGPFVVVAARSIVLEILQIVESRMVGPIAAADSASPPGRLSRIEGAGSMDVVPFVVVSVTAVLALVAILAPYMRRSRGRGSVRAAHARRGAVR
jgi:hypothetical protein